MADGEFSIDFRSFSSLPLNAVVVAGLLERVDEDARGVLEQQRRVGQGQREVVGAREGERRAERALRIGAHA